MLNGLSAHVMPPMPALPPEVFGWSKCPSFPGTASLADKHGLRGTHEDKVRATYQKPPRDRHREWPLLLPPSSSPLQSVSWARPLLLVALPGARRTSHTHALSLPYKHAWLRHDGAIAAASQLSAAFPMLRV